MLSYCYSSLFCLRLGGYASFHDIVIHDEASANVGFHTVGGLKIPMAIHFQRIFIIFIAGQPNLA